MLSYVSRCLSGPGGLRHVLRRSNTVQLGSFGVRLWVARFQQDEKSNLMVVMLRPKYWILRDLTGGLQSQIPRSTVRQLVQYRDSRPGKVKMLALLDRCRYGQQGSRESTASETCGTKRT